MVKNKKSIDKSEISVIIKTDKTRHEIREVIKMFKIFKKTAKPMYVITNHYVTHVAYSDAEMYDILANIGYDAQVTRVN